MLVTVPAAILTFLAALLMLLLSARGGWQMDDKPSPGLNAFGVVWAIALVVTALNALSA